MSGICSAHQGHDATCPQCAASSPEEAKAAVAWADAYQKGLQAWKNDAEAERARVGCHLDVLRSALAWYVDYGEGAAKEPKVFPSQGVALGMLQHDGGKRARTALEAAK